MGQRHRRVRGHRLDRPKPFLGEDEYGRFAFVQLADDTQPVNFIVHRGDTKDPDNSPDRSFVPGTTPEIWLRQGDVTVYTSQAEAQGYATVHYACADCSAVTIDAPAAGRRWHRAPRRRRRLRRRLPAGAPDLSAPLTVTIRDGGVVDIDARSFTPTETPTAWFQVGDQVVYRSRGAAEDFATIHYRRPAGDYGDPTSATSPTSGAFTCGPAPRPSRCGRTPCARGQDVFGVVFRIDLVDGADQLAYILHRGDTKDPGPDQFLVFAQDGHEVWQLQGADPERPYVAQSAVPGA